MLHHKLTDASAPFQTALDVSCSPRIEVPHGEGKELACKEVEGGRVDAHCGKAQEIALHHHAEGREREDHDHGKHEDPQEAYVLLDQHPIHHDLGEHRQHHL